LLAGDERAFAELIRRYNGPMLRVARSYVPSASAAEEVVGETWLAILEALPRFEGRSSLKTWMFRILMNRAITFGQRERRSVPFSSLERAEEGEPTVDPDRFQGRGDPAPGAWSTPPASWDEVPESRMLSGETLAVVREAIDELPPNQRTVISLRDVSGWGSQEVCNLLGISETNQRVLLHRARAKVRRALERYLDEGERA
jgi:RNA polymerase sigma-70 factor (ECF subfamily)